MSPSQRLPRGGYASSGRSASDMSPPPSGKGPGADTGGPGADGNEAWECGHCHRLTDVTHFYEDADGKMQHEADGAAWAFKKRLAAASRRNRHILDRLAGC